MNDIIFVEMKKSSKEIEESYPIWPGDRNDNVVSKEKNEENTFDRTKNQKKEFSFMQNRYFSVENAVKINQIKLSNNNDDNAPEIDNKRFRERNDYLIEKLFKSRNLPLPTDNSNSNNSNENTEISLNLTDKNKNKLEVLSKVTKTIIPDRNNIHKEEYIKLSTEDNIEETETKSDDRSISRKRAYPEKCMERVNQHLFDLLKTPPGSYTDRTAEIAKIKVNIKSRFDQDNRLLKRIKRDTEMARNSIHEKLEFLEKKRKLNSHNNDCQKYHVKSDNKNKNSKKIKYIKIDEDSEEEVDEEDDDDDDDDDDVICMIDQQETYLNNESTSNLDDTDSKCFQLRNLNYKKDKNKNSKYKTKNLLSKSNSDKRINIESQLKELELNYKQKRDERNKLLKKKKNLETNIKREIMTNELKVIRRNLKKLRRKRNAQLKHASSSSNTNGLVYFENNNSIKNKSKNNKKFFKKKSFKSKTNKLN